MTSQSVLHHFRYELQGIVICLCLFCSKDIYPLDYRAWRARASMFVLYLHSPVHVLHDALQTINVHLSPAVNDRW